MNVRWNDLQRGTTFAIKRLTQVQTDIEDALGRPDHKDSVRLAKLRSRIKDAILYLQDGLQ